MKYCKKYLKTQLNLENADSFFLQGLGSRVSAVRLSSLWYVFLLGIPVAEARSSSPAPVGEEKFRSWMLFCRQAVIECNAVQAMWMLWDETAASLNAEVIKYCTSKWTIINTKDSPNSASLKPQTRFVSLAKCCGRPVAYTRCSGERTHQVCICL